MTNWYENTIYYYDKLIQLTFSKCLNHIYLYNWSLCVRLKKAYNYSSQVLAKLWKMPFLHFIGPWILRLVLWKPTARTSHVNLTKYPAEGLLWAPLDWEDIISRNHHQWPPTKIARAQLANNSIMVLTTGKRNQYIRGVC